ncbi:MAG: carbon monoxide dehydrogenase subunit G [Rhodomicrobiaceae bacterium]
MKLSGEKILPLPQARVWQALNDPEVLRQSIPGCESFEKLAENAYRATVASRIGPVRARFQGTVRLSNLNPPNGYTLSGEGSGGAAGSAKGSADVSLEPAPGGTRLAWTADAQISGKLAQIGSRLIESSANMMAGQFFDRFEQILAGEKPSEALVSVVPAWAWIAGAAVIIIAVILYLVFA